MSDLLDLYQEVILDHHKRPRNRGELADADHRAEGHNPLCGDRVTVTARLDGDRIADLRFEGEGCAISTASASLMTEAVKGRPREEVEELFRVFQDVLTGRGEPEEADLGKLAVLAGVREFPVRVKCATLAWHTLRAALEERAEPVTTE